MRYPAQFHPVVGCSQLTLAHEGQLLVDGASMLRDSNSVFRDVTLVEISQVEYLHQVNQQMKQIRASFFFWRAIC